MFIINSQDQQHPEYTPSNFSELVNDGWFEHQTESAIPIICPNGPGSGDFPKTFPKEEDYLIANNGFDYGDAAGSRIWSARRQLYREISRQDNFDSLPLLFQNYYVSQSETSVGQFEQVEAGIEQAFSSVTPLNESITTWTFLADSINQMIASLLEVYLLETDSSVKLNILLQINDYKTELDSLLEVVEVTYTTMIDSLGIRLALVDDLNGAIVSDSLFERIQQDVNHMALAKMMTSNFTLNASEMELLDSLAAVCSLFGGEGIYRARSLALIFGLENHRDDSLCVPSMLPRVREQNSNTQIQSSALSVYPNPASHILHIFVADPDYKVAEIRILDILGNVINKFANTSVDRSVDLEINQIYKGIYRLEVKFTNGMVNSKIFLKF
ncbi:MAG: T9SS type A sorting domain-containing protein [Saprospiraceae bacterium]|nr:T9SS type A sorting domain-containing protein [Saprospiraceae bacterium]